MGTKTSHLILFRSTAWKWMSTTTITTTTTTTTTTTSTSTSTSTATTLKSEKEGTVLFKKLAALGYGKPETTVAKVLDEWKRQGHSLHRAHILTYVTQLRRFNKHHVALQLYEWMEEVNKKTLRNTDHAIRIDLLARTKGIASAEKYFNSLPDSSKTKKTYGALLNCYCHERMVEKATELFGKIKELNFHDNILQFNNMMNLYRKVGMPEKVPLVVQEMVKNNIELDSYSYNQLLDSYGALKDIDAVEGVLRTMKSMKVKYDWWTFGSLANVYLNAGLKEKAIDALKKLEKRKIRDPEAIHTLLTLYTRMSDAAGVNRAWKLCKSKFPKPSNISYLMMHLALSRLEDFDGLEKLFREWESSCSNYDIRICNVLLESYLKRDMIEEADMLYNSVIGRGVDLNLRTHNAYMNICLRKRQIDLALQALEEGVSKISSEKSNWFPPQESVDAFFRYFEAEKDDDAASKFCEIMKKNKCVDVETKKLLVSEVRPSLIQRLEAQFLQSRNQNKESSNIL